MRTKTSIEIYNYWDQIRGSDAGPVRSRIEPGAIRHILPELFILEANATGSPLFRLAGTHICSLFGRELRDSAFSALWPAGEENDAAGIAAGVIQHAIPAFLNLSGFSLSGRTIRLEMVLLPVRSSANIYDRLLGSLTPETAMSWFGADPLECLIIERSRLIGPTRGGMETGELGVRQPPAASNAGRGSEVANAIRRALHLRVVEGGRPE